MKERKSTAIYKNEADLFVSQQLQQVAVITLNCCLFIINS
jgi:hypothetical protein